VRLSLKNDHINSLFIEYFISSEILFSSINNFHFFHFLSIAFLSESDKEAFFILSFA
jgi:hypothetical protein